MLLLGERFLRTQLTRGNNPHRNPHCRVCFNLYVPSVPKIEMLLRVAMPSMQCIYLATCRAQQHSRAVEAARRKAAAGSQQPQQGAGKGHGKWGGDRWCGNGGSGSPGGMPWTAMHSRPPSAGRQRLSTPGSQPGQQGSRSSGSQRSSSTGRQRSTVQPVRQSPSANRAGGSGSGNGLLDSVTSTASSATAASITQRTLAVQLAIKDHHKCGRLLRKAGMNVPNNLGHAINLCLQRKLVTDAEAHTMHERRQASNKAKHAWP